MRIHSVDQFHFRLLKISHFRDRVVSSTSYVDSVTLHHLNCKLSEFETILLDISVLLFRFFSLLNSFHFFCLCSRTCFGLSWISRVVTSKKKIKTAVIRAYESWKNSWLLCATSDHITICTDRSSSSNRKIPFKIQPKT